MGGLEGVIIGWLGVNIGRYGLEGHGRKKIINIGDGMKCVEYVNFITRKNYFENAKKKMMKRFSLILFCTCLFFGRIPCSYYKST